MKKIKSKYIYLIISILLSFFGLFISHHNKHYTSPDYVAEQLRQKFSEKESQLFTLMDGILQRQIGDIPTLLAFCDSQKVNEEEFVFYVYQDDSLRAWSSNMVSLPTHFNQRVSKYNGFVQMERKTLFARQNSNGVCKVVGMYLLESSNSAAANFLKVAPFYNKTSDIKIVSLD